jgi:hypothetical protein
LLELARELCAVIERGEITAEEGLEALAGLRALLDLLTERVTIAIQSGIIFDDDGSICMAFVKEGCPIKVLKAK